MKLIDRGGPEIPINMELLSISLILASAAHAQEILPFPPAPSASSPGLTIQDSTYK